MYLLALLAAACATVHRRSDASPCTHDSLTVAATAGIDPSAIHCKGVSGPAIRRIDVSQGRDALDSGADLLLTDDPSILEYAAAHPGFASVALPWDRVYVLLWTGAPEARPMIADAATFAPLTEAVRVEARVPESPSWLHGSADCARSASPSLPVQPSSRLLYPRENAVARDLAERLVALAGRPNVVAVGLADDALTAALHSGDAMGYVIPISRTGGALCDPLDPLRAAAPWLTSENVTPLVETRVRLIVRRGTGARP